MATLPSFECFRPIVWGFRQRKTEEEMKALRQDAEDEYPSLPTDDALLKYVNELKVHEVFFPGIDGRRTCWGRDLKYFKIKEPNGYWGQLTEFHDDRARKFLLFDGRPTLAQVDQPKDPRISQMLQHTSEIGDGWALSSDHRRHITNFPEDILSAIFDQLLIYGHEDRKSLRPEVITCNWKREWCMPHYHTGGLLYGHGTFVTTAISRSDHHGEYFVLRDVYRADIDATVIRVCKSFRELGIQKLYGLNDFDFEGCAPERFGCPPRMSGRPDKPDRIQIWRPSPLRPSRDDTWEVRIAKAISAVETRVYYKYLPGWLYYDKFLRFLHEVGPESAAHLMKLRFSGRVEIHTCDDRCGCIMPSATSGLLTDLELYLPFLVRFCTSLHTMTIESNVVEHTGNAAQGIRHLSRDTFRRFLREELSKIESLRVIKIRDYDGAELKSFKDITDWFAEQGRIQEFEQAKDSQARTREFMQRLAI